MAQTVIRAAESTENIPSGRRVRDVVNELSRLDPDIAPLTQILQLSRSASAQDPKFEWGEKDLEARWDAVNGTTGTGTSIVVDNSEYFSVYDVVQVVRTGELIRVTAVTTSTDTLTVARGVGSTSTAAVADNDDLLIVGNAYPEGSLSGTPKSHTETMPYNYTEITRTPAGVTGTEMNSTSYFGDARSRLRMEKGQMHKIDLERTAHFGQRNIDTTSTDNPVRYTGGLYYFFGTAANVTDVSSTGTLTMPTLETFLQSVFQHTGSSESRLLLAAPAVISIFDLLGASRIQTTSGEETFGMKVKTWLTSHGTLNIVKDRLLENGPTSGQGYGGEAWALDIKRLRLRYLSNRNTKFLEDIHANDYDGVKDEYLTEAGWEMKNPLLHGRLTGVTA